jgi:hypothetical protein
VAAGLPDPQRRGSSVPTTFADLVPGEDGWLYLARSRPMWERFGGCSGTASGPSPDTGSGNGHRWRRRSTTGPEPGQRRDRGRAAGARHRLRARPLRATTSSTTRMSGAATGCSASRSTGSGHLTLPDTRSS